MSVWTPRATVACVVEDNGRYLMVEERDKTTGKMVFNQPAGHLDENESLAEGALRETFEETGWRVELQGILSISLYKAPSNGVTFHRTTFLASPIEHDQAAIIDSDIHAVHWLDLAAIEAVSDKLRSPLVLASIERQRRGICYPLDVIES
ncbi:MAG: NUDIX hydrolase [Halioglobus sp.]